MKDTLQYIISHIVDKPDAVVIDERQEDDATVYTITADKEDIGRIIGKHGRIIRAIRDLIKIIAVKENRYVDVEIADGGEEEASVAPQE